MNKYIIPAILGAVVLMAGMFAFAPVQKVSAVHGNIATLIDDLGDALCDAVNPGEEYDPATASCFNPET